MTTEHRDRIRSADGTITDIYIDRKTHQMTVKESFNVEATVENNKREFDVNNRHYHRDMEKVATIDARALHKAAMDRGTNFQEFVRDKKEMSRFLKDNPVWKTRPGKF